MPPSSADAGRGYFHSSWMVALGFHLWSNDGFSKCLVPATSIMSTEAHPDDASLSPHASSHASSLGERALQASRIVEG
ncbi:hypothetical protein CLOM_g18168 [Closterium sp. NIES-68]|nr:hypothetical protein CLOM_g18168 [Closterium sp. NIES-68]